MRIAFIIGTLGTGGAERQIAQLADGLVQRGHHVFVVTLYPGGQNWAWLQNRGSVQLFPLFKKKLKGIVPAGLQLSWSVIRLRRFLQKERISLIYSVLYMSNLIAWLAVRWMSCVKLIWGIRASNLELNWKRALPFHLCRWVSATVPLLIANSKAGLAYHEARGYRSQRCVVIPNGIDTERFRADLEARARVRAEWGVAEEEKLIGLVGRLDPMKGHPTFLKAAELLAREREDVRFVCVGDGPPDYRQELHALGRELGLAERLIWAGTRRDMPAVYNALDIATTTSSYGEGFPNVIGEAMACGVPCVVTDVGDSVRIVGDVGIVVRPKDPQALARGLRTALMEVHKIKPHVLRDRIAKYFSVQALVEATEKVLID